MITLNLDEKELQAMVGLMDAGVKALGIQSAEAAAHLLAKIGKAKADSDAAAKSSNVVPMAAAE